MSASSKPSVLVTGFVLLRFSVGDVFKELSMVSNAVPQAVSEAHSSANSSP